jgi:drug/metabolite transporter (DMT)-like permease
LVSTSNFVDAVAREMACGVETAVESWMAQIEDAMTDLRLTTLGRLNAVTQILANYKRFTGKEQLQLRKKRSSPSSVVSEPVGSTDHWPLFVCYSTSVSRSVKAHILLVVVTMIWGTAFVLIKNALADISPLLFNAIRMSLAAVVLAVVFHGELTRFTASSLRSGFLVGAFLFLGNELQTVGLKYTTPSKSAFLTGVSVVLVPVFLALFWRRRIHRWVLLGVTLAFIGLYLLTIPASPGAGLNLASMSRGDVLTLASAFVFGFHIIFVGHASQAHSWRQIAILQIAVTALLMICTVPLAEKVYVVWSPAVIWGIVITGTLSLALAFAVPVS